MTTSDENSKTPKSPPFQLFQQSSEKTEPDPLSKPKQAPTQFQPPPIFQKPATEQVSEVKQPSVLSDKQVSQYLDTGRKFSKSLSDWVTTNKKKLLIVGGVIAVLTLIFVAVRYIPKKDTVISVPSPSKPIQSDSIVPIKVIVPESKEESPNLITGYAHVQTKQGSSLNLRSEPSEKATVIMGIPNKSLIQIIGYSDDSVVVNGEKGKWCKCRVAATNQEGWVWGGFVTKKLK
jgi:hypothetical protein